MDPASADLARQMWATRMEQVERALVRGHDPVSIHEVTEQLEEGAAQVFFAEHSTAVTKVFDRGNMRSCEIWLAGGYLPELIDLKNQQIEPFAREMLCDRMLIVGRRGWRPFLPDYKPVSTVYLKELGNV